MGPPQDPHKWLYPVKEPPPAAWGHQAAELKIALEVLRYSVASLGVSSETLGMPAYL